MFQLREAVLSHLFYSDDFIILGICLLSETILKFSEENLILFLECFPFDFFCCSSLLPLLPSFSLFTLHTISAFLVLQSLVLIHTTNVISKNHDFGVLTLLSFSSVSRVAILFLSLSNSLCFSLDLTVPILFCFPCPNISCHLSSATPHFCISAELKQGLKSKLPSTSPFKSFLTCFTFDPFYPMMQSCPMSLTAFNNSCFHKLCFPLFHLHSLSFLQILPSCTSYQSHEF